MGSYVNHEEGPSAPSLECFPPCMRIRVYMIYSYIIDYNSIKIGYFIIIIFIHMPAVGLEMGAISNSTFSMDLLFGDQHLVFDLMRIFIILT